jgi:hypothetical protein
VLGMQRRITKEQPDILFSFHKSEKEGSCFLYRLSGNSSSGDVRVEYDAIKDKKKVEPSKNEVRKPKCGESEFDANSLRSNLRRFLFSENDCLFNIDNKTSS